MKATKKFYQHISFNFHDLITLNVLIVQEKKKKTEPGNTQWAFSLS